jgi:selenide,water dikinase
MKDADFPLVRDLVLAGGGHAHALILRAWGMRPQAGVRLTLVNPGPVAGYTGMLPGVVAGHYRRDEATIDLVRLCRFAGARLVMDRAAGIDRATGRLLLAGGGSVPYDVLSLDVGIAAGPARLDGALAVRPLDTFVSAWEAFAARAPQGAAIAVVGGGVGGVEMAMAAAHRLRDRAPRVTVVEAGRALTGLPARADRLLRQALADRGVTLVEGAAALAVSDGALQLADGRAIPADLVIAAAGAVPQGWLATTGLALHDGHVAVDPFLRASDPAIFAAGDCAHLAHDPRPKAGVFAVRAAPVLLHNLRAALSGRPLRRFHPQADYLKLVSTGGRQAVALRGPLALAAPGLWRWKDRIDRRFMDRLTDLPLPPPPAPPHDGAQGLAEALGDKPLCGGCGAKVGPVTLAAMTAGLAVTRPDVLAGAGDDAAILLTGGARQVIATDHLRALFPDPALMGRIAAIHALGDIWAMGAAPQAALASLILPRASDTLQARMLDEVMTSAGQVMAAAGAAIVGGHTTMGAELTVGFTVTGLADRPVPRRGGQAGDALVLTKAIGTGTVLAAEMAMARLPTGPSGLLLGEAVAATLAAMLQGQGDASAVLAPVAHAMTDVTGFGLAGHLAEMLEGTGLGAQIDTAAIPLLPGALALAGAGVASSIANANRAALVGRAVLPPGAIGALMVDPQTCGGLLAAVPSETAEALVADLRAAGENAAVIGRLTDTPLIRFA